MITLDQVTKCYGKKRVLHNVSGEFEQNMIHGILGPNGCGKTTLIKAMLGLVHIDQGSVEFNGVDFRKCRENISWLPQRPEAPHNTCRVAGLGVAFHRKRNMTSGFLLRTRISRLP